MSKRRFLSLRKRTQIRAAPRKRSSHAMVRAIRATLDQQLSKQEEENTGLQAVHAAAKVSKTTIRTAEQIQQTRKEWQYRKETKDVQNSPDPAAQSNVTAATPNASAARNRVYQKQNLKREYAAAKHNQHTSRPTYHAGNTASHAAEAVADKASSVAESVKEFFTEKKHYIVILTLAVMLLFVVQSISACSPIMEGIMYAMVAGTYPAEEADIRAAERYYANMERELQKEMDDYLRFHPEYDEATVKAQEIWHDPYALIALVSAYRNGESWKIDDVYGILQMLFNWQYERTETVTTETRYDDQGTPYTYTKVKVTLKNKNLSHAPVYIMDDERVGLYALYMSTLGNYPDLFHGPHVSTLKEPLRYDVPQELLDADSKFTLLVEEANKRLGYPYVWGGHTPMTSFDCSGFISWIFTETGVVNIGHQGATGLFDRSQKIMPDQAKPGDVVFFTGTLGDGVDGNDGVTHCGLYVGNNMMIHCGNPISYADLTESYWRQHFLGFGRLYAH